MVRNVRAICAAVSARSYQEGSSSGAARVQHASSLAARLRALPSRLLSTDRPSSHHQRVACRYQAVNGAFLQVWSRLHIARLCNAVTAEAVSGLC